MTFILGILLLLLVFWFTVSMFKTPISDLLPPGEEAGVKALGSSLIHVMVKIVTLFLMTLAGSIVAGKGIHLYLASVKANSGQESANE